MDYLSYFLIFMFLVVIGLGGFVFYIFLKYRNILVVKEVAENRKIIHILKARDYKENGVEYWLLNRRLPGRIDKKLQIPPPEAIEIDKKGKKVVQCVLSSDGSIIFQKDTNAKHDGFQPLKTEERIMLINDLSKAAKRKKVGFVEMAMQLAPFIFIIILVGMILFQWEEIQKPAIEVAKMNKQTADINAEILEDYKDLIFRIQTIDGKDSTVDKLGGVAPT